MKKVLIFIISLFTLTIVLWGGYQLFFNKELSYIILDINPSIELAVNEDGKIEEVLPLNEDAVVITSNLDLEELNVEEASEKIIDAAIEIGYINELSDTNTVLVTSIAKDESERIELEKKVIDRLNSKKVNALVVANGLSDELKEEANKYDIAYGKMLLVERAFTYDSTLDKEELSNMSIKEIQAIIKQYVKEKHDDKKLNKEEAKLLWEQKKDKFKVELENKKEQIWNEVKEQYKNVTTNEKNNIIENLVKERKEQIKNELDTLKDELNQEKENINDNKARNYPVLEDKYNKVKDAVKKRKNS